jgi:hypothetical protein
MLKTNYEVLVMNCIYKINRYKFSLFIISEQTTLHSNFYAAFCFMKNETIVDYVWMLQQLRALYAQLELSDSTIIVTNMKRDLMSAIKSLFSNINHLFCLWHINNNVLSNCKKSFSTKKEWDVFFAEWKTLIYAASKEEFEDDWKIFSQKYVSHEHCIKYLIFIYIAKFRRHFVKCYINKVLHFEIIIISRDEDDHVVLKRQLESSFEDLKTMINAINLLLMNEYQNYLLRLKEQKIRYSLDLRKKIYQQLFAYITHHVLRKISHQYDLLTERSTALNACINDFIIITELSCSHRIQNRMFKREIIQLEDVHSHWRYVFYFFMFHH